MSTDRMGVMDPSWDAAGDRRRAGRPGWLARLTAALGRALGRRPAALSILDPGAADAPTTAEHTRPIDTHDLVDVGAAPRRLTTVSPPPPVPRARTAPPASRRAITATTAAQLAPGDYDPLEALITVLVGDDERPPPPAPTDAQLDWLERLGPLVEYELVTRGGTAITFQSTAAQLRELVALDDTDFNAAVRVVSRDPAVAATILSAANSAERQRGNAVGDIRTAVARLGLRETRRLGVATATSALYDPDVQTLAAPHRARAHRDLHRAMTCAFAGAALAGRGGAVGGEDAFITGMFHDLGKPLVHRAILALERRGRVAPVPPDALELVIERIHAAIGAETLLDWGLPRRLGELARHHLTAPPPASVDGPDLQRLALVSSLVLLRVGAPVELAAARRATTALGLARIELRALALEVDEAAARVSELFGVRDGITTWSTAGR